MTEPSTLPSPDTAKRPPVAPRLLLAVLVFVGVCVVILRPGILETLGVGLSKQWFLDSYAILAANDAVRAGIDVQNSNPLDALNRPHVYSDWWLGLRWLGLTRDNNFALGGLWVLAFLLVALASVKPRTTSEALVLAVLMLSPPFLIAVQRGNNDLLIFSLLGAGLLALRGGSTPARLLLFGASVVLATGLKYYPLVAAGALIAALPWRRAVLAGFVGTAALALLALASERNSIGRGMFELPQTIYQFGAPVLWRGFAPSRAVTTALALGLLGAGAFAAIRGKWTLGLADENRGTSGDRLLFATGAIVLLGCFLAGTSYIYRWVFALWLWPWLAQEARRDESAMGAKVALGLLLVSVWTDGLLCLVVNSLGLSFRPGAGWRVGTQLLNWALMALLAGWVLEALCARGAEWLATRRRRGPA